LVDGNGEGSCGDKEGDTLEAGRSCETPAVDVGSGRVAGEEGGDRGEIEGGEGGRGARGGYVGEVGDECVEE
jgi:hypothetical protein